MSSVMRRHRTALAWSSSAVVVAVFALLYWRVGTDNSQSFQQTGVRAVPESVALSLDTGSAPESEDSTTRHAIVELQNVGAVIVHVLRLRTGCGCTSARIAKAEISPNQVVELSITAQVPSTGEKNTYVDVITDLGPASVLRIPLRLRGGPPQVPYLSYRPVEIALQDNASRSSSFELRSVEASGTQRWIKSLSPRAERVRVLEHGFEEVAGSIPETVERRYRFEVGLPESTVLAASTNDLLDFDLTVPTEVAVAPLVVMIRHVPRICVVPDSLFIRVSSDTKFPLERIISVLEDPLERHETVISAGVAPPVRWLEVHLENSNRDGDGVIDRKPDERDTSQASPPGIALKKVRLMMVRLSLKSLPDDFDPATRFAKTELQITTSDPEYRILRVPIVVAENAGPD